MPPWAKIAILAAAILAAALWLAQLWQGRMRAALVDSIEASAGGRNSNGVAVQAMEELPAPVARYLNHVLSAERRRIRLARYEQVGRLRTDARSSRWMHFTARQVIAPAISEFVWDARVSIMPLLHVRVRDSLVDGRGAGQVTLLSAIPVGSAGGNMEMNSGSLHRFLAEAVWYPTALLPSAHLRWDPIDEARALATLKQGDISVSLEFRFNRNNEVTDIYTPGRWGSFDGGYRQVGWEGRFRDYAMHDGVVVPTQGEVGWYVDGGWHAVWRGIVVQAALEFE
ncbi:MAG: DUF6544 family protein [Burkholderiaceae bacterium]